MSETAEHARAARSTEAVLNAPSIARARAQAELEATDDAIFLDSYHGEGVDQPRLVGSPS